MLKSSDLCLYFCFFSHAIAVSIPAVAQSSSTERNIESYKNNPYVKPHPIYLRMTVGTHWQIAKIGPLVLPAGPHGFSIGDSQNIMLFDGCYTMKGDLNLPTSISRNQNLRPDYEKPFVNMGRFQIYPSDAFPETECLTNEAQAVQQAYDQLLNEAMRFNLQGANVEAQKMIGPLGMGPSIPAPRATGPIITLRPVNGEKIEPFENLRFVQDDENPLNNWIHLKKDQWVGGEIRGSDGCNPIGGYYRPTEDGLHIADAGIQSSSEGCEIEFLDRDLNYKIAEGRIIWSNTDEGSTGWLTEVALPLIDPAAERFTPKSQWRLTRYNDEIIDPDGSHGIRIGEDQRLIFDNGCYAQQAAIWFGNGKLAVTPNGIAADGMNRFLDFNKQCRVSAAPQSQGPYSDFLNKAWRVSYAGYQINLSFLDRDGTKYNATLSPDKIGKIGDLVGKKLTLVKASGVNSKLAKISKTPFVAFTDQRVGGYDGCNGFGGSYRFVNGRIKTESIVSTLMGCGEKEGISEALYRILHPNAEIVISGDAVTASVGSRVTKYELSDN